MKHSNISIFIPHAGCPHMCSFCNQKTISGSVSAPTAEDVHRICSKALLEVKDRKSCEIAFFGGSFTAIERDYMISLLEAAREYIGEYGFYGIRVSTRPDFIDDEILETLKRYGVTSVELGAQSMKNKVLAANERGHSVEDVYKASALIRKYGFELGLQMMVGLYKSTLKDELDTRDRIINIHPDTVRIYPVAVLEGTKLAELYRSGEYELMRMEDVISLCAYTLLAFHEQGIEVIKCGLHASDDVQGNMVAGFYHPAFRELCESRIYRDKMQKLIIESGNEISLMQVIRRNIRWNIKGVTFSVNPSCVSRAIGHKKENADYIRETFGIDIKVLGDVNVPKYHCEIRG